MRVVDVLQIFMQEPRVAFKQAQLIAVDLQMKDTVAVQQKKTRRKERTTVIQAARTEKKENVTGVKRSKGYIKSGGKQGTSVRIDISA